MTTVEETVWKWIRLTVPATQNIQLAIALQLGLLT